MTPVKAADKGNARRGRQQRRSRDTRQRLLNAAREVFAERGLDLTRIDEITDRADVGKGTFYYHFHNKERLIRTLMKSVVGELEATIAARCSEEQDLTALMESLISSHIEFFSNRWEDFVLYFQGRADLTLQQGYEGLDTPFVSYLSQIETLIANATSFHLPRPVLRRVACAVAGMVSGYYSFAVISSEGEDVDAVFRSLRGAMVVSLTRFIREAANVSGNSSSEDKAQLQ